MPLAAYLFFLINSILLADVQNQVPGQGIVLQSLNSQWIDSIVYSKWIGVMVCLSLLVFMQTVLTMSALSSEGAAAAFYLPTGIAFESDYRGRYFPIPSTKSLQSAKYSIVDTT